MNTLPAAQPFFFPGNKTGLLLVHGLVGLPRELLPLGQRLAEQGYTVSSVLLAGHGQHPEALSGVRWEEWYSSVETAWHELQQRCDQIIPIGYSLGGLLALHLAARQKVSSVITLSAALHLAGGWPLRLLPVGRYLIPWFYPMRNADFNDARIRADLIDKLGSVDFDDPVVVQQLRTNIRIPTSAIHALIRCGQHVRRELPNINVPVLVLQGRRDEVVLPVSAEQIYAQLASPEKQLIWFEHSGHELPNGVELEDVVACISQWLVRHAVNSC